MNKNKGIWLVIAAILMIGIAVTFATSRFIRQNGGSLDTVAVAQMPGTAAGGGIPQAYSEGTGAEPPAAAGRRMEDAAPAPEPFMMNSDETAESAVPDTAAAGPGNREDAAAVPSISPLGPAGDTAVQIGEEEKLAYYEKRLGEIDTQIQKMRSESSDSTSYSMKTLAEKELKLWNVELNAIYAGIINGMDDDARSRLESEQQTWMKSRDTKAEEAAGKYSGGSLEGVEYTASQAESTRTRTYDLVETYINELPAENED